MVLLMPNKLGIMGVPVDGEYNSSSNNKAVWDSVILPEATLKRNHVSICFHAVHEAVCSRVIHVRVFKGKNNLDGCLTQLMP